MKTQVISTLCGAFSAVVLSGPAVAGPDRLAILLGSEHIGATRPFEEVNPGVFLTWEELILNNKLDVTAGAYRNSYGDGSLAATTALPIVRTEHWGLDLFAGLAWYPDNGQQFSHSIDDIVPIAGVQARYRNVFVQALPSGGTTVDAVISFGLTFDLNKRAE